MSFHLRFLGEAGRANRKDKSVLLGGNAVEFALDGRPMGPFSSLSVEELVRKCAHSGEIAAWEEFVCRFHRLIAKIILRTCTRHGGSTNQTVDELIQDTYLKLCADNYRLLREFDHRHP